MKRFTETNKWCDPWFRKLDPKRKLLWGYLTDNCDQAGVIEIDWELATFQIGTRVCAEDLDAFEGRVATLPKDKLWIRTFVQFQYGKLSRDCKPHNSVFSAMERHGITENDAFSKGIEIKPIGYAKGIDSLQDKTRQDKTRQEEDKDKEKEKDKEKDKTGLGLHSDAGANPGDVETLEAAKVQAGVKATTEITAELIYQAYPRKIARVAALKAITKAMQTVDQEILIDASSAYAAAVAKWPSDELQFVPHPSTWFGRGSYDDDRETWKPKVKPGAVVDEFGSLRSRKF